MISNKYKYRLWFKAIAIGLVCLFAFNSISWSRPESTLAAQSRLKPFFEKHGLGFQNIATVIYAAGELKNLITSDSLREGQIVRLNSKLQNPDVEIEREIKQGVLKCTGKEYSYAVFRFKKENKTIHALFLKDHANLTPEELKELRITEEEVYHLDCPSLEGVWFINNELSQIGRKATGKKPEKLTAEEVLDLFPAFLIRMLPDVDSDDLYVDINASSFTLKTGDVELASLNLSYGKQTVYFMLSLAEPIRGLGIGSLWIDNILVPYARSLGAKQLATDFACSDSAYHHFIEKMHFKITTLSVDDTQDFHGIIHHRGYVDLSTYHPVNHLENFDPEMFAEKAYKKVHRAKVFSRWHTRLSSFASSIRYWVERLHKKESGNMSPREYCISSDEVALIANGKRPESQLRQDTMLARRVIQLAGMTEGMSLVEKYNIYSMILTRMEKSLDDGFNPLDAVTAEQIHTENLKHMPAIPDKTILCHIVADSILPDKQKGMLKGLEQDMRKRDDYIEKVASLSVSDPGNQEEFMRELERIKAQEERRYREKGYTVQFDVACPSKELVGMIQDKYGLQALAFFKEGEGDIVQVEGIILALRVLRTGKIEDLRKVYKLLTGNDLKVTTNDIKELAKSILFVLPVTKLDVDEIDRINTLIEENIKNAA
ncbi:MAG: hypothetical protein HQ579_01095 [Candidatus Omnitrophica bacterium]|nr:hypothetical protein [Candidatus Omnitrophota bacterium]